MLSSRGERVKEVIVECGVRIEERHGAWEKTAGRKQQAENN
jgi:hypothetical protein